MKNNSQKLVKKRWTQSEIEFLYKNKDCSIQDIAEALERTESSVHNKKCKLGISMDADLIK